MPRRPVPIAPVTAVLVAVLALAGCGAGAPPEVTFAAAGATAVARPTQYCEDDFVTCRNDATAPVTLPVPVGTPLEVTVPTDVSDTPWQIVFTYRDAAGAQVDERTRVFRPEERPDYALELPAGARLLSAQVQQYGPPPEIDARTGEIVFPIRSSWVLTVGV